MMGFTLKQAVKYIEESGVKGWKLKPIKNTDLYELSRTLTSEEIRELYRKNGIE